MGLEHLMEIVTNSSMTTGPSGNTGTFLVLALLGGEVFCILEC